MEKPGRKNKGGRNKPNGDIERNCRRKKPEKRAQWRNQEENMKRKK